MVEQSEKFVKVLLEELILKELRQNRHGGFIEDGTGEEVGGRVSGGKEDIIRRNRSLQLFEQFHSQSVRVKRAMTEPNDFPPGPFRCCFPLHRSFSPFVLLAF